MSAKTSALRKSGFDLSKGYLPIMLVVGLAGTLVSGSYAAGRLSMRIDATEKNSGMHSNAIKDLQEETRANREARLLQAQALEAQAKAMSSLAASVNRLEKTMSRQ